MNSGNDAIRSFLHESGPFGALPDAALDALARRTVERRLPAGEVLALREGPVRGVYGLRDGFVKAVAYSPEGRGFLADIVGPGGWLGFAPLLRGSTRYFDLHAEVESRVLFIDEATLRALLTEHPALYRGIALVIAERYELALSQLRAGSFLDAEAGLAFRLSMLLAAHGRLAPGGGLALPFRISQEELGQLIGVTREAVGRCLRKWEKAGWIDLGYAQLVVREPDRLRAPEATRRRAGLAR